MLVDSNIFIDYYLNRFDGLSPIGEYAFNFFKEVVSCKYFVFICEEVIEELSNILEMPPKGVEENVLSMLSKKHKLEVIAPSFLDAKEAGALSRTKKIPFNDALFAIVAKNRGLMVVSRDRHFFNELSLIVGVSLPEELK